MHVHQNFLIILIAVSLLCLEAHALYAPDLTPSSPSGFHERRLRDSTGFRLPGTARPTHYDLKLHLTFDYNNLHMEGEVLITLDVDDTDGQGTYSLQLNSEIRYFPVVNPTFLWNDQISCDELLFPGPGYLTIKCPQPINGTNQRLRIRYWPVVSDDMYGGAYVVKYRDLGVDKVMVATQFEHDGARRIMPCFDEPSYKAPIQLTLTTDASARNFTDWVSNTKVVANFTDGATYSQTFAQTPTMSTYLLAFVATEDFALFTDPNFKGDYTYAIFARPSLENYVSIAIKNVPLAIDLMGNFTGIPYPALGINQMTVAAIPESLAGAMGNWGLIIVREQILIDEGSATTGRDEQYIKEVICHEVSHQWFGDYVTTNWWSETWLNEGLAEYFQYFLTDQISSDYQMMQQLIVKEQQLSLKSDAYPNTIPLANNASDVTTEDDFIKEFNDVSYAKGSSVVKMLRYAVGNETFQKGLQLYLNQSKYSTSTSEMLLDALQSALTSVNDQPLNLKTVFHEWIYNAGYPVLDVSLDSDNKVTLKWSKFSSSLNKTGEDNTANWWLPLTYTTSDNPDFETVDFQWIHPDNLKDFSLQLVNDSSWVIFNLQSSGYYRVNYDETLWNRIMKGPSDVPMFKIHVINRAQLLDDAFNVARSYEGSVTDLRRYYATAFNLSEYLQSLEYDYAPWYTYSVEMQYLLEKIQDSDTLTALKEKILDTVFARGLVPPLPLPYEYLLGQHVQVSLGCKLGDKYCVSWAREQFENYKNDSTSIDSNFRDVIICTGLANSNDPEGDFNLVLNRSVSSNLPLEQKDLAKALPCTNYPNVIFKALLSTLSPEPPFSRMLYDSLLMGMISDGRKRVPLALEFVLTYHEDIALYWKGIESPETALKKVAAKIQLQEHIDVIQKFIQENEHVATLWSMVAAANEAVKIANENVAWLEKYGDILESVLVYGGGDITSTTPTASTPTNPTTSTPKTTTPGAAPKMGHNTLTVMFCAFLMKMLI